MTCTVNPKNQVDVTYRHDFHFGSGTEKNGDFEEIEQGFNHTLVTYRKQLTHDNNMDNLRIAVKDAFIVLQKEVAVRHGMKRYFALKLTFRKAIDQYTVTDPPIVLNTHPTMGYTFLSKWGTLSSKMGYNNVQFH